MLGRVNSFCGQNDEVQYQPVAGDGDVAAVPAAQDNTALFNQIPADVLALIAAKLPTKDLIPFFLTNKNTLELFEDFNGNKKLGSLRVFMPTSQESLYEGAPAEINFRDVNHVLMAQYFLNIKKKDLESREDEVRGQDCKRECLVIGGSVALGVTIGLVIHAGVAALLDRVVLPACFECCVTNATSARTCCWCGGNVLTAPDQVFVGMEYASVLSKEVVPTMMTYSEYLCANMTFCYIPVPMVASCPAAITIGCAPWYEPCHTYMLDESYEKKHERIDSELRDFNSSSMTDFTKAITLNDLLRERKRGASHRMFHAPVTIKMEDEAQEMDHNNNAPQVPQRIVME